MTYTLPFIVARSIVISGQIIAKSVSLNHLVDIVTADVEEISKNTPGGLTGCSRNRLFNLLTKMTNPERCSVPLFKK